MVSTVAESCPRCQEPRLGPFCERCGHSYAVALVAAPSSWCAYIAPDRDYFQASDTETRRFTFPAPGPAREVPLIGPSLRIGRRSSSRGTTPEIDLADPPADPAVSREHARLLAQPDGTWAVLDEGSTNGTYLNNSHHPIPIHRRVPLIDGDRIHVGLWTTITIVCSHSTGSAG